MSFLIPQTPNAPPQQSQAAAAPAAPDRSDNEIQSLAAEQRKRFGIVGGRSMNDGMGGRGVPVSSIYTAATSLLGGGSAT